MQPIDTGSPPSDMEPLDSPIENGQSAASPPPGMLSGRGSGNSLTVNGNGDRNPSSSPGGHAVIGTPGRSPHYGTIAAGSPYMSGGLGGLAVPPVLNLASGSGEYLISSSALPLWYHPQSQHSLTK
jgi:hypothetical protein